MEPDTPSPSSEAILSTVIPGEPAALRPAGQASGLKAVLWDMDGTLVDTEPYWIAAEHEIVAAHGGTWSHEQSTEMVGSDLMDAAAVLQAAGVTMEREAIVDWMLDRVVADVARHMPWRPGARELLADLVAAGVPCALVTMSYRRLAEVVVAETDGAFTLMVAGDDVDNGKPHPEPYLTAAARLGVPVEDCVAIEDSPTGIASALAAGARTLAVEAFVPVTPRPGLSRATTLDGVTVETLARIAAGDVLELS
ncbi:MAG: HAD family phosphatase [Promicromonosporaceae bacterium]|nr:HAD family phosphatase [Promicromonosporaceae bacterium]